MSTSPARLTGMLMTTAMALTGLVSALPVAAADDPEAAVEDFLAAVAERDYTRLDEVTCEAERGPVREAFDIAGQLGLPADDPAAGALRIEVADPSVDLLAEEGDSATVRLQASLTVAVDDDSVDDLVRAILEADLGPDDPPPTDEDVEMMAGFMGGFLNMSQPIDEEVSLVREDGEWLVCGGLVDEPEEPTTTSESSEGLCGFVGLEALNAVSAIGYDSSQGFETMCTYLQMRDDFASATVSFDTGSDLETLSQFYGVEQELEVAGRPAFFGSDLLAVALDGGVLQVSIFAGEDAAPEAALAEAISLAELFVPLAPELSALAAGPEPDPTPEPTPEISLCEALSLAELNEASGLEFTDASGDGASCSYTSVSDAGLVFINAYVAFGVGLEDYGEWLPDAQERTIAGLPGMQAGEQQVLVQLPGDMGVLDVSAFVQGTATMPALPAAELAILVAERIIESGLVR